MRKKTINFILFLTYLFLCQHHYLQFAHQKNCIKTESMPVNNPLL